MSKVTIITTSYKHQDFIAQTIESVLNQTFLDWELLIGDDSPDMDTWNVIQTYVGKYPDKIRAWHHETNKGIVDNMNFLLGKVSGDTEYIAFLEGDDLFDSTNLEKKINIFSKNNEIISVINNFTEINANGEILSGNFVDKLYRVASFRRELNPGLNKLSLEDFISLPGNPIKSFGVVMIKKSVLDKFTPIQNIDKNNKMFGPLDYFLWLNMFPDNYIYYIKESLFKYRVHENNFSGDGNVDIMLGQTKMIFEYLKEKHKDKNLDSLFEFKNELREGILNAVKGNKLLSFKHLLNTFKYFKLRYISYRIKLFLRILVPNYFIRLILKKGK